MSNALICPKCGSEMRSYERNEVVVDQCTGCGGLFLDRGELEKLTAAETAYYGGAPQGTQGGPPPRQEHREERREYRDDRRDYDRSHYKKKSKKRSFLEELFD